MRIQLTKTVRRNVCRNHVITVWRNLATVTDCLRITEQFAMKRYYGLCVQMRTHVRDWCVLNLGRFCLPRPEICKAFDVTFAMNYKQDMDIKQRHCCYPIWKMENTAGFKNLKLFF